MRIWFLPSSTHKAFGPKRTWGMRFIIVCVLDPNRYLSDMNILARLHMWRMGGEKFTIHAPKSCFGEASLPVKIPVTDGSFGSNLIDLTKKWFLHPLHSEVLRLKPFRSENLRFMNPLSCLGSGCFFVNLMPRWTWCEGRNQICTYVYIHTHTSYIYMN